MAKFSLTSQQRLRGVHPSLQLWAYKIVEIMDCKVIYGVRTIAEQAHMVQIGASQTMNSYHLVQADGWGHAVDLAPYPIDWKDLNRFVALYGVGLAVAHEMNLPIVWGGDWDADGVLLTDQGFDDYSHWQLPRDYSNTIIHV